MVRKTEYDPNLEVKEKLVTESVFPNLKTPEDLANAAKLLRTEKATGVFVIRLVQGGFRRVTFQEEQAVETAD